MSALHFQLLCLLLTFYIVQSWQLMCCVRRKRQALSSRLMAVMPPTSRRQARRTLLHQFFLFLSYPPLVSCEEIIEPLECQDGAIVYESAVPGAYQQVCMSLPQRNITLKSTGQGISVLQGNVSAGRTGVAVWNSCILLTRLLDTLTVQNMSWLTGKTVVELGCGTALASITAAKLGASRVLASDGNPSILELTRQNIIRNQVQDIVEAVSLQWGFLDAADYAEVADVVIGSDLTYNSGTWRVLAETFSTILKPGGMVLYLTLGHAGFNVEGELNGFLAVVQSEGLEMVNESAAPAPFQKLSKSIDQFITIQEQSVLDATGGVRVVLLRKPAIKSLS